MKPDNTHKIFGIGPLGALLSLLLLALFAGIDRWTGHPHLMRDRALLQALGATAIGLGLGLHGWSFATLRRWWLEDQLCTQGPFQFFRHPMYAAWISFICPGVALCLNSWVYLVWALVLHPLWHNLVGREEKTMEAVFGNEYRDYASRTGRFILRLFQRRRA